MTTTVPRGEPPASRGRIDKRHAILRAAFSVFSREGYAQACVKEIAAEAGVAKPTVYNHLDSKENLFRHAVEAAAERAKADSLAAVGLLVDHGSDLRALLRDVGERILHCYAGPESSALRRLLYAEVARFPELLEAVSGHTTQRVQDALADRLARLSLTGRLRACDPDLAAEHFLALLTGPLETRTRMGTRTIPAGEMRAMADAAVETFLRAFGAQAD